MVGEISQSPGFMRDLSLGVGAAVRGLLFGLTDTGTRKTYRGLLFGLMGLTLALEALLAVAVVWVTGDLASPWLWIVRSLLIAVVFLVSPLLAVFVAGLALPWWGERVLIGALHALHPAHARNLEAHPPVPATRAAAAALRRLIRYLGRSAFASLLSWIPGVGAIIAPCLGFAFTAHALAVELVAPYLERLGRDAASISALTRGRRFLFVGFGAPFVPLLAVPLVGPLAFGAAQAAAAVLVLGAWPPAADGQSPLSEGAHKGAN